MFMHGGIMHIAGNMWFLWIFGDNIEEDMGRVRYLIFYLLCGLIASLTHVLLNTSGPSAEIPSLGASGAISGVMGGYLVLHPHRRVTVLLFRFVTQVPGYVAVGIWFLFQIVSGWFDGGDRRRRLRRPHRRLHRRRRPRHALHDRHLARRKSSRPGLRAANVVRRRPRPVVEQNRTMQRLAFGP